MAVMTQVTSGQQAVNEFLTGSHAPVRIEQTLRDLPVTGRIPEHLDGRYLRIGPNPIAEVDPATYHWFSGDGMVHGIRLRGGRAEWYRNRWVRGREAQRLLGEVVDWPLDHRAGLDMMSANTNVIGLDGRTVALVESGVTCVEMTDELDTVGPWDFDGTLFGGYTAHPHRDPLTDDLHAVSYSFGRGNTVQYSVLDRTGRARRTVDIEVGGSPMMHDFSLTQSSVVIYDLPVTFHASVIAASAPRGLRKATELALGAIIGRVRIPDPILARMNRAPAAATGMPYLWNDKYPARIGVMPREGGNDDVRWYEIEPAWVFHPMNAHDAPDGTVVLDVIRHPKVFAATPNGFDDGAPRLERWTLDPTTGGVRQEILDDRSQEFPRIDERRLTLPYRYGYAPGSSAGPELLDTLVRHDLHRGTTSTRTWGPGFRIGEFVFEPNAPEAAEDDGVLMGFVHDAARDCSDLVLLDAATLEQVAAVHLPCRVPDGFHGNWVPTT